jgi:hypothetical protein
MMLSLQQPPLGFLLAFLLFSLIFLSNTFRLWFNTEKYYQDLYNSLTRSPMPFKEFFLMRLKNRKGWEVEQKIFSLIGIVAVVGMDVLVVMAYLG